MCPFILQRKMEIISSTKNQHVKFAKSLCQKKFRNQSGLFLIEGINLIKDLGDNAEIVSVFVTEDRAEDTLKMLALSSAEVYYVSEDVLAYLADTVTPNGVVAVVKKPQIDFALPRHNAVLLDGVSDPGNLGTIIRTAAATGFDVYLLDTVDLFSPKVIRSTLGACFKTNVYEIDIAKARELVATLNSVVLDMNGKNLLGETFDQSVLFIAGSEAHGVREEFLNLAKNVMSLPLQNGIESLNVAIASAVAMYKTIQI